MLKLSLSRSRDWERLWESYWFAPSPLFDLAVCRIIIVLFQLNHLLQITGWLANSYTNALASMLKLSAQTERVYEPLPLVRALTFPFSANQPPSDIFLILVFWVTVFAGILSLIGLKTRLSLIFFAIGSLFITSYIYSYGEFHHPEALVFISLFALAFSPSGESLSVDDLMSRAQENVRNRKFRSFNLLDEQSKFSLWPLRLIQCLLALAYASAAASKLANGGLDWLNGYTLQYYLLGDGLLWNRPLGILLAQSHVLCAVLSWVALIFEATFFLVLIFPRLAWIYIPLGAAFHIGIYLAQWAPFFSFIALYSAFVPWTRVLQSLSRSKSNHRNSLSINQKPEILFDGECPLCIRSMTAIRYLDWFDRITYSELQDRWQVLSQTHPHISLEACLEEMHMILPNNSVRKGFFAFREVTRYLPVLYFLRPVLYFPGMSRLGDSVYRFIAARRPRFLQSCHAGFCSKANKSAAK